MMTRMDRYEAQPVGRGEWAVWDNDTQQMVSRPGRPAFRTASQRMAEEVAADLNRYGPDVAALMHRAAGD